MHLHLLIFSVKKELIRSGIGRSSFPSYLCIFKQLNHLRTSSTAFQQLGPTFQLPAMADHQINTNKTMAQPKLVKEIHTGQNGAAESLSSSDRAKKAAAFACGEAEVKSGMRLGIGSGTTMKFFIDWLNGKQQANLIKDVKCVPTSFQTRNWLKEAGLAVYDLDELNELDLAIDGADEVDANLNCIKGGGGCLLQEKTVQHCAKRFIVIGGLDKYSECFGKKSPSVPIEIAPLSHTPVQRWIVEKHGGHCILRMDAKKCFPVITENHNYIVDWHFPKPVSTSMDWNSVNQSLLCTPGVAETGLFIGVAEAGYFATEDGQIQHILPKH